MSSLNTVYRWQRDSRIYAAWLSKDLLGDLVVTRINGSTQSKNGMMRTILVKNEEEGEALLTKIAKTRRQHGYQRI